MDEKKFKSLMAMSKTFMELEPERADFWRGFQRGLRRHYHGEDFGGEYEHNKWMNCANGDYRKEMQTGYRLGFYYGTIKFDGPENVKEMRMLLLLSVAEVAKIAGVSPRTVEGWEQGRSMSESAKSLIKNFLTGVPQ